MMHTQQYNAVKKVLWIILFLNFAVAAVKIGVGLACKSQSVISDGIHSIADGSSNVVGLIGIWLAAKPRDARHPYGHDKFEIMASLFIGAMLGAMAIRIAMAAISSFASPAVFHIDIVKLILLFLTIVTNVLVAWQEYRFGKKLKSTILVTDSIHTRGDILISAAVLLGLVGISLGIPVWIDAVLSLFVAAAVLLSAYGIVKSCVDILVDSTVVDGDEVKQLLMTIPGIYDIHHVRSRGEASHIFIDLHAVISPCQSILYTHDMSHRLETVLKEHFGANTEVNIHLEPDDGRHTPPPAEE